jgi:hypothetical protein
VELNNSLDLHLYFIKTTGYYLRVSWLAGNTPLAEILVTLGRN